MGADILKFVVFAEHVYGKDPSFKKIPVGKGVSNRDGTINIYLDALPVNGRLVLEPVK